MVQGCIWCTGSIIQYLLPFPVTSSRLTNPDSSSDLMVIWTARFLRDDFFISWSMDGHDSPSSFDQSAKASRTNFCVEVRSSRAQTAVMSLMLMTQSLALRNSSVYYVSRQRLLFSLWQFDRVERTCLPRSPVFLFYPNFDRIKSLF